MPDATADRDEPESLADVSEWKVYRIATAARLLGMCVQTFKKYAQADGLFRPTPTAWTRVFGREILRIAGQRVIDRAARTGQRGETQTEREKRAAAAVQRIMAK